MKRFIKKLLSSLLAVCCFSALVGNVGFAKMVTNGSKSCTGSEGLTAKSAETKEYNESEADAYFSAKR